MLWVCWDGRAMLSLIGSFQGLSKVLNCCFLLHHAQVIEVNSVFPVAESCENVPMIFGHHWLINLERSGLTGSLLFVVLLFKVVAVFFSWLAFFGRRCKVGSTGSHLNTENISLSYGKILFNRSRTTVIIFTSKNTTKRSGGTFEALSGASHIMYQTR